MLLNAGIALALTQPDSGDDQTSFDRDLHAGLERAAQAIDSGAATRVIERWVEVTRS